MKHTKLNFISSFILKFFTAITLLAGLFVLKHFFVQSQIETQTHITHIINEAGRQRMLSQKITKDVLYLMDEQVASQFYFNDIMDSLAQMDETHVWLENINDQEVFIQKDRNHIDSKYEKVTMHYQEFYRAASLLAHEYEETGLLLESSAFDSLRRCELLFLEHMDDLVNQYESLADEETKSFYQWTAIFNFGIVGLIFTFSILVFYPVVKKYSVLSLDISESNENLRKMIYLMRGSLFLINEDGDILLSNQDAEAILKKSRKGNIGRDLRLINQDIFEILETCTNNNRIVDKEVEIEDNQKELRTALLSVISGQYNRKRAFLVSLFDITERKKMEVALQKIATRDELTGLYNRHFLDQIIDEELNRCKRYQIPLSGFILDLDHFKLVNDQYGHPVGDSVLKFTADLIRSQMRISDYVIRIGGEEFLALLPNTTLKGAYEAAEKVRKLIEVTPHPVAGVFTASIGVAEHIQNENYQKLYGRLDQALYQAKENGRNQTVQALLTGNEYSGIFLKWNNQWNLGNQIIDEQHHMLFKLVSKLTVDIQSDNKENTLHDINDIILHVEKHFHDEEVILQQFEYEGLGEHKKLHSHLLKKMAEIKMFVEQGRISSLQAFLLIFEDVILGHLINEDMKFAYLFQEPLKNCV